MVILRYPLVMTHSSPWFFDGPNRNRWFTWFTWFNSMVIFQFAMLNNQRVVYKYSNCNTNSRVYYY